ncbi:MAG TPA: DUF1549 domain-containing protein [Pirellulales bacterium]|jgi:hypothetical protein|nr:DUF1549 domain-containing protein [Pirellulales bacterium]
MRQSMTFSAAGIGLIVGLLSGLALRDGQAEQPTVKFVGAKIASSATAPVTSAAKPAVASSTLAGLTIVSGGKDASSFTLAGRDSRQQLIVTEKLGDGELRDLTRQVRYTVEPTGIVRIDQTGLVWPLADGKSLIVAEAAAGHKAMITVVVTHFTDDPPVNFPNQIVPIFTKLGCNAGGCHGKASGQNGFRLSLLGFVPSEDYEHLVMEGRGRRLSPAAPDSSLLLQKAAGLIPHGGGQRMEVDSVPYKLLRRWIVQGMPYGKPDDPVVSKIEVVPAIRTLKPGAKQQLICLAHYSDGSVEDVTLMTKFEPNDTEMAEVSSTGLVTARDLPGTVAIMARYQGQVAVFRAALPLGAPMDQMPAAKNFIDEAVFKQLKTLGIPPSPVCDDATFVRRASIDIAGRLPTAEETARFLTDADSNKRAHWIDELLASDGYADYFATKWTAVLRNKRVMPSYEHGDFLFHDWIRQSLYENKPYDQFVRDILTASGEVSENPPVAWYREAAEPAQEMEDTAQLFLGMRIQCAHCHHHPFERWSQQDYFGFDAFFSRVGKKQGLQQSEFRIYHRRGMATAENIRTHEQVPPAPLGGKPVVLSPDDDPRQSLVDWMVDAKNPYFAPALANRYWKHFFGRGLVEPEDDMRATNPASNPELLAALAEHFAVNHHDLKDLVRTICNSQVYQLSAVPNRYNAGDHQSYSHYYPKRLTAEVLLDAVDQVTGAPTKFNGMPMGTRAIELPDSGFNSYFLTVFGRPEGSSPCECERSNDANLAQSLHLLNSVDVQQKVAAGIGRAATLAEDKKHTSAEKIDQLYLEFYSRHPAADETEVSLHHIAQTKNDRAAYEDILWALINTKEFLFNH